jgi:hypothetical protein
MGTTTRKTTMTYEAHSITYYFTSALVWLLGIGFLIVVLIEGTDYLIDYIRRRHYMKTNGFAPLGQEEDIELHRIASPRSLLGLDGLNTPRST